MNGETASERAAADLHRFFCDRSTVAAICKRCGKLTAVYWGHDPDCTDCTMSDDGGWRNSGRCQCDPRPVLPDGSALAGEIAKAAAARRLVWDRALRKIYV
ncbi:hypothetical protein Y900_025540 [Mycolicibacterium aromaticivorans JS19b1 = JCM 16368]|uniref:Uncharacterized protein n=1 Tax=Mycolicibacterium aromaticivorans JS19b1 = JCM 16368 TaxID=1440774 RepID=A0A064CTR4_9MYCO|nr:hypothetical protein [Mycolicibacterium aromaticivorans]KDF02203.1 hypothetical protein Y900_025540 [Mycolicibacterium aromaticivorans JS19b1 = JCM 16368]